jgi:hypothetical protein
MAEYMSYNSELQLFRTVKGTKLEDKIERIILLALAVALSV